MNIYLPLVSILGTLSFLIYIIFDFINQKTTHLIKRIAKYSFFVYLIAVAHLTIGFFNFPLVDRPVLIQLVPFFFIKAWLLAGESGTWFLLNSIKLSMYNLIMLTPLGIYLIVLFGKSIKSSIKIIFFTSLLIESLQLIFCYIGLLDGRSFDVDDLILNTLGGALGSIIGAYILNKFRFSSFPKTTTNKKIV